MIDQLREDLRRRLESVDRGETIELADDEALDAFLDGIELEVDQALAAKREEKA